MYFYPQFYQRFGVRTASQLLNPRMPNLTLLELPQKSIFHYIGNGPLDVGPETDEFIFRKVTKPIQMMHIKHLAEFKGAPRPVTQPIDQLIRAYHNKHRRYRWNRNLTSAQRDPLAPLVINYAWLARLYRYQRTMYTDYNRWWNINATVWKTIGDLTKESDRQHFVELKLPQLLPGLTDLRIAAESQDLGEMAQQITPALESAFLELPDYQPKRFSTESLALEAINARILRIFHTPESLMVLELWKWSGPQRAKSLINEVPLEQLDKINLIFTEAGRWLVINLGTLNKWRNATEEELAANPEGTKDGIPPTMMQKRVLRMLMSLFQARTDAAPQVKEQIEQELDHTEAETPQPNNQTTGVTVGLKEGVVKAPVIIQTPDVNQFDPKTNSPKVVTTQVDVPELVNQGVETPIEPIKSDKLLDAQIDKDLAALQEITEAQLREEQKELDEALAVRTTGTLEESVMVVCKNLAAQGMLSAAEMRRYETLSTKYHQIIAPDGQRTLKEYIQITPEETKIPESPAIPDIPTVIDKTMLKSSLHDFDSKYIKHIFHRDVAAMVMNIQHAGICVTDYQVERHESITGSFDAYTVRVTPVEGSSSTLRFRLPVLNDDGTYLANGVKYHLRKQRGDLPIRKVAPGQVKLTSYYGSVWVRRSEKKVDNYGAWLRDGIMSKGLDMEDTSVTDLHPLDVFDPEFKAPRLYSSLAMGFKTFKANGFTFMLDHTEREKFFGADNLYFERTRTPGVVMAANKHGDLLMAGFDGKIWLIHENQLSEYMPIEEIVALPFDRAPVDFATVQIWNRVLPLAFVLGYEMGLSALCRFLKVTPRIVPAGQRLKLEPHEYPIIFEDESWVFSRKDSFASLILAGLNDFHLSLRSFGSHQFDKKDVYLNLLETQGASARYIREIDLAYQLFVDPITRELLVDMKEPTDFRGLLLRSAELLMNDQHPDALDPAFMRVKGLERMAGTVYSELVKSIRAHNGRAGKSRYPIELNPYAVWTEIQTDPAKGLVTDINPIQNLKEKEAMTFSGTGGRSSRSMTKKTRKYHPNDMGVTSEATVDSGDVGINTYTSADPQFNSLRGTAKPYVIGKTGATALFSTSALISPGADRDDAKRTTFISIQHGHGVACRGYTSAALRTGYEQVIAHRTSDLYATTAKMQGKVISRNEHGIIVEYADGSKKAVELGRRYGAAAGLTIPHEVLSPLQEGDKVSEGDVIAYNPGFFKPDVLNPKNIVWKAGILVRTVLMESTQTLEDSSSISKRVSELLATRITKERKIVVNFDQSVRNLVKPGQELGSEDILCYIEDSLTADNQLFNEESLNTLSMLSAQAPQAKFKGVVERVEIFYHGDLEDMSASLRTLVSASDKELSKRSRAVGKPGFTGSVGDGYRVDGTPLAMDTACIVVYLSADVPAGVGDKGVFANQMKTVFGEVLENEWKTESGLPIDAVFGAKSIADRIVSSPYLIGTTTTLLDVIGKKAVALYRKN